MSSSAVGLDMLGQTAASATAHGEWSFRFGSHEISYGVSHGYSPYLQPLQLSKVNLQFSSSKFASTARTLDKSFLLGTRILMIKLLLEHANKK